MEATWRSASDSYRCISTTFWSPSFMVWFLLVNNIDVPASFFFLLHFFPDMRISFFLLLLFFSFACKWFHQNSVLLVVVFSLNKQHSFIISFHPFSTSSSYASCYVLLDLVFFFFILLFLCLFLLIFTFALDVFYLILFFSLNVFLLWLFFLLFILLYLKCLSHAFLLICILISL